MLELIYLKEEKKLHMTHNMHYLACLYLYINTSASLRIAKMFTGVNFTY